MIRFFFILSFTFSVSYLVSSMEKAKQMGKEFGQKKGSAAFEEGKKIETQELLADDLKDQTFDSKDALSKVKNRMNPQSKTLDFLTSSEVQNHQRSHYFHEDELFVKTAEKIITDQVTQDFPYEKEMECTLHTCKQAGEPFLITTERTLNVQANVPAELTKICLGHQKNVLIEKKGDFKESTRELKKKYKHDPTIDPESVKVVCLNTHPTHHYYLVGISWKHRENSKACENCHMHGVKDDSYQKIGEAWLYDNQDIWNLSKSPDSTIIEHVCLDSSIKMINGQSVSRQCWKEKLSFFYQFPSTNDCNFLRQKNCEQIKQECIQFHSTSCIQWQFTFLCNERMRLKSIPFEFDPYEESMEYLPNQSFSEVAAKLAVFDEVKKEMEKSKTIDVRRLEIFKGKRISCSKNVVDHLMYDCCFSYAGLAKQMGLSKCHADEIGLAEMREQGLCHYIGSYEEKFLDLWKSRDEHVFCCFPSKLSRIVQEGGREQLGITWGTAKEPNCRGLATDELSSLNFSKMDLSEICENFSKKLPENMPQRLQAFQHRLQQDIEQAEIKK